MRNKPGINKRPFLPQACRKIPVATRNKEEVDIGKIVGTSDMKKVKDMKGNPLLLFVNPWSVGMTLDRNKGLVLTEFGRG